MQEGGLTREREEHGDGATGRGLVRLDGLRTSGLVSSDFEQMGLWGTSDDWCQIKVLYLWPSFRLRLPCVTAPDGRIA